MKIKEMTWQELKKDFAKILDKFTEQELVDSLDEYCINSSNYTMTENERFNLIETEKHSIRNHVNIGDISYNMKDTNKEKGEKVWKSSQQIDLSGAA